jgi:RNA polymerase sigma factor (sigma-70 family)
MPTRQLSSVMQHLRRARLLRESPGLTDGQLLERFLARREEAAFEVLVDRHGAMVLGVCRRVLHNAHDAEDAFQASFLVLVRKAASLLPRATVGDWLYGVAWNTALKARAAAAKRRRKESEVTDMPRQPPPAEAALRDWLPLLDQELQRLPDRYRAPIVLCNLEGKSRKEAAVLLGWKEGTLSGRLARGRQTLAKRLARHGELLSGGAVAVALANTAAGAGVPRELVVSTVQAAGALAAGLAPGVVSAQVAALVEGVFQSMSMTKFKAATVLVLALGVLAAGVGVPAFRPTAAAQTPAVRADDAKSPGANPAGDPKAAKHSHTQGSHHHAPAEGDIRGSGKHVTRGMDYSGFTTVDVGRSFQVSIRKGDAFRTEVTSDDNLFPYIHVAKDGKTLKITLDTKGKSFWATRLNVAIAMPALEGVTVDRGGRVTCTGFRSDGEFTARISGRGSLIGDIEAGNMHLDAFQGGVVELKGATKELRISATGTCQIKLGGLAADRADVRLRDASSAAIKVKENLDFDLDGVSRLEYDGDPFLGKQRVDGGSSFLRVGDRRGAGVLFQGHDHMHALQKHHQEIHAAFPHLQFGKGFTPPGTKVAPKHFQIGQKVPDFVVTDLDGKQ